MSQVKFYRARVRFWVVVLIVMLMPKVSMALDVMITGSFTPDPLNPGANRFELDFPHQWGHSICATKGGEYCRSRNYIEVKLPQGAAQLDIPANPSPRNGIMMAGSGAWHPVDIVNASGVVNSVQVRVVGAMGSWRYRSGWNAAVPGAANESEAFQAVFGHAQNMFGSCINEHPEAMSYFMYFYVTFPATCVMTNSVDLPELRNYDPTSFLLEVLSPNPLSMQSGVYTGNLTVNVGNGAEVDYGDVTGAGPQVINLSFNLSVTHAFNVQFPGGSKLLSLVPEGGWMAWLQRGRKPTRLYRDQNFDIVTSGPFKMRLLCEFPVGASCGIQNGSGHEVALDVSVTMPPGFRDSANQPVSRYPLTSTASLFKPEGYQIKRATMHFEVPKTDMETMLDHAGTRYSGTVTIIFEPEL